jgi:RNA polymerase sigma factor (TIGR02999 family)
MELVYTELHRLASGYMRRERSEHTLQPSALINEAYLRLIGQDAPPFQSRTHFYVTAAQVMRRILIDHARARSAEKRGAALRPVPFEDALALVQDNAEHLLELDIALDRLGRLDNRQRQIVELRFFAGLSVEETAQTLGISDKTVKRDWAMARAWLEGELRRAR